MGVGHFEKLSAILEFCLGKILWYENCQITTDIPNLKLKLSNMIQICARWAVNITLKSAILENGRHFGFLRG